MKDHLRSQFSIAAIGAVATLFMLADVARAEYRLQAGDVLEVLVANAPEMRQRLTVQMDGTISILQAGTVVAEGSGLSDVRSRIRATIGSKIIRLRTPDGRETSRWIEPDEIAVGVVEFKPVFVTGDVQRVAEQVFRPRMTVRQALASAGGISVGPIRTNASFDAANLKNEYVSAWVSVAAHSARLWSIGVELGSKQPFDSSALPFSPLGDDMLKTLVDLETQTRASRIAAQNREKELLRKGIQEADQQIELLTDQQRTEERGAEADAQDLKRAMEAFGKGNLPSPRVTDYRRAVLLSSTRKLQTSVQLVQVKRGRTETIRQLDRTDDDRRVRLMEEQREEIVKLSTARAGLQAAEERLRAAGASVPRMISEKSRAVLNIVRGGGKAPERLVVTQDTELEPGDVLEVNVTQDHVEASR